MKTSIIENIRLSLVNVSVKMFHETGSRVDEPSFLLVNLQPYKQFAAWSDVYQPDVNFAWVWFTWTREEGRGHEPGRFIKRSLSSLKIQPLTPLATIDDEMTILVLPRSCNFNYIFLGYEIILSNIFGSIMFLQLIKQIIGAIFMKYERQVCVSTNDFPLRLSVFAETVSICKKSSKIEI